MRGHVRERDAHAGPRLASLSDLQPLTAGDPGTAREDEAADRRLEACQFRVHRGGVVGRREAQGSLGPAEELAGREGLSAAA